MDITKGVQEPSYPHRRLYCVHQPYLNMKIPIHLDQPYTHVIKYLKISLWEPNNQ